MDDEIGVFSTADRRDVVTDHIEGLDSKAGILLKILDPGWLTEKEVVETDNFFQIQFNSISAKKIHEEISDETATAGDKYRRSRQFLLLAFSKHTEGMLKVMNQLALNHAT